VIVSRLRSNLCRDTRNAHQICTWTAKTRANPSLHRDIFLAPLPRGTRIQPMLSSGNTRPRGSLAPSLKQPTGLFLYARPYCRAVMLNYFVCLKTFPKSHKSKTHPLQCLRQECQNSLLLVQK
jgi:hypothetical protein